MNSRAGAGAFLVATRRAMLLFGAGLIFLVPGACATAPETVPEAVSEAVPGSAVEPAADQGPDAFVTICDTGFQIDGRPYRFVGANFWFGMNLASTGPGGDRERLDRELDLLRDLGITNLRVMAGSEGPDSEPWRVIPALQTAPGVYDQQLLDGLDYLLAAAARRGLRLVLCLNNFWPWTGGMAQYVAWHGGGPIPYPVGPEADWDAYQEFAARFYSSAGARESFLQHVTAMVTRINPLTGMAYRDDPVIMAWELANEPRGMGNAVAFNRWIDDTASMIKSLDPNHLVTTGCEGDTPLPEGNGLNFTTNHDGPDIDYATVHIWPQNWGWYDPLRPEETFLDARLQVQVYLEQHVELAARLGKPLVLEEFGLARDGGAFDHEAPTSRRDILFAAMFAAVEDSAAAGGPLAGSNFWAWAGEGVPLRPGEQWQTGDPWSGDPPHERQGWYGVYRSDRITLSLIRFTATALTAPMPASDPQSAPH